MRVAVMVEAEALGNYLVEVMRAWGLACVEQVDPHDHAVRRDLSRWAVIVCSGAVDDSGRIAALHEYVEQGGTLICMQTTGTLAELAGVELETPRDVSLRLRVSGFVVQGLAGEALPVPAGAGAYRLMEGVRGLAWLYEPNRYDGMGGETVGIAERALGSGRVISFAFDLARSVLLLRQGDPALADRPQRHTMASRRMAKPANMAADIGPYDTGQIPFADLLGRVLVDVVLRQLDAPVPMLSTLPASASGVVLFSGDEDNAATANVEQEFAEVAACGARMNLYIMPELTHTTPAAAQRYAEHHDLGPHPDLLNVVDEPVATRAAEYERQIRVFMDTFGIAPRSIRNHAAGWTGYLDLVHVQQRCGIRMDLNFFSGHYAREREHSLFSPFGSALPMRFCEPGGEMLDVFQQHTHLHDDILFAPDRDYSYKLMPEVARELFERTLDDLISRFPVPLAANFHPGNWNPFSREPALELLSLAREKRVAVWSYDQWLTFWEARDTWRVHAIEWDGAALHFAVEGEASHDELCLELPVKWQGRRLQRVTCGGADVTWSTQGWLGRDVARLALPTGAQAVRYEAVYETEPKMVKSHSVAEQTIS